VLVIAMDFAPPAGWRGQSAKASEKRMETLREGERAAHDRVAELEKQVGIERAGLQDCPQVLRRLHLRVVPEKLRDEDEDEEDDEE